MVSDEQYALVDAPIGAGDSVGGWRHLSVETQADGRVTITFVPRLPAQQEMGDLDLHLHLYPMRDPD